MNSSVIIWDLETIPLVAQREPDHWTIDDLVRRMSVRTHAPQPCHRARPAAKSRFRPFLSFAFICPSTNSALMWETPVPLNSYAETTAYLQRANAD